MKKDKYHPDEKRLCQGQENLTKNHVNSCKICKTSFDEYNRFGVSVTPPCQNYKDQLEKHMASCSKCQQGNKKWNEDAVEITPEMRSLVGDLKKGNLLSIDTSKLKKVVNHLTEKLELSSSEIRDLNKDAEKKVRDGLGLKDA